MNRHEKRSQQALVKKILTGDLESIVKKIYTIIEDGNYSLSKKLCKDLLEKYQDDARLLYLLALSYERVDNIKKAAKYYDLTLKSDPKFSQAYFRMGNILHDAKQYEKAIIAYKKTISIRPDHPRAYYNLGSSFQAQGLQSNAIIAYQKNLEINPGHSQSYFYLGCAMRGVGKEKEAEQYFEQAISINPDYINAYHNLVKTKKYESIKNNQDAKNIARLLQKKNLSSNDYALLFFALGKIYDSCKLYDKAFEFYKKGNDFRLGNNKFDTKTSDKEYKKIIKTFNKTLFKKLKNIGSNNTTPVFVVGLSRSGKTLTENILQQHPDIYGAGELSDIYKISSSLPKKLGKSGDYLDCIADITPEIATEAVNDYLKRLRVNMPTNALKICDTMPSNIKFLGLITILFPNAKIVICQRNPIDTCLFQYFKYYESKNYHSYKLDTLAFKYDQYKTLTEHWLKIIPENIKIIQYEDLIEQTEKTASDLFEFIGVDWNSKYLDKVQLSNSELNYYKKYENHLESLIKTFT